MANINDYLRWRGDLSFEQSPINEVDAVLLVFVSYLEFKDIIPSSISETITLREAIGLEFALHENGKPYYGAILPNEDMHRMAKLMSRSNRFSKVKFTGYVNEICEDAEEQFTACTSIFDDGSVFISFKGTDDTLVGWKEDLNLSFEEEIPGQRRAVEYLEMIAAATTGKIRIGGHSKGGNLAVYAAAKCSPETQSRIVKVYNNDGPGFNDEFFQSDGYQKIKPRILKLVPQESVVGMLLVNDEGYTVVRSSGTGVFQHNSYLWEVSGRRFIRHGKLTEKSLEFSKAVNGWIDGKDIETRKEIVNNLYSILKSTNAKTLTDFSQDKNLLPKALLTVEPQKREMLFRTTSELTRELIKASVHNKTAPISKPVKTKKK